MAADRPLDAYSLIVSGVAEKLTPKVASLRVPRGGPGGSSGESLGSGVVFTGDGFLLTNAHVVGRHRGAQRRFSDGTTAPFRVVGADPLSDLAVLRATGPTPPPAELGEADDLVGGPAGRGGRQPAGAGGIGDRRRGQRAGPVAARGRPSGRGSSRTSSRPTPRSTPATPVARWPTPAPGGRHQHRRGRGRAGHRRPRRHHHPPDRVHADAGRTRPARLPGPGHGARAADGTVARAHRPRQRAPRGGGRPRWPGRRAGLRPGDLLLSAAGSPVAAAQDLQRLMFAEAIGKPLAITVVRNGALVDVIAEPSELVACPMTVSPPLARSPLRPTRPSSRGTDGLGEVRYPAARRRGPGWSRPGNAGWPPGSAAERNLSASNPDRAWPRRSIAAGTRRAGATSTR